MAANRSRTPEVEGDQDPASLPQGYRQALVTAITLFQGFAVTFLMFWAFEASGSWTPASVASALWTAAGVVVQMVALARALDIRDEQPRRYRTTVRVFLAGVAITVVGVGLSSIVYAIEGG